MNILCEAVVSQRTATTLVVAASAFVAGVCGSARAQEVDAAAAAQVQAGMMSQPAEAAREGANAGEADGAGDGMKSVEREWTVSIEPAVWFVGAGGDLTLPRASGGGGGGGGGGATGEAKIDVMGLDDPQASAMGEVNLGYGRYRGAVRAAIFNLDDDGTASEAGSIGSIDFAEGDALRGELDMWVFEAQGGYRLHEYAARPRENGDGFVLRFYADGLGGVRAYGVDWLVDRVGGSTSPENGFDDTWIEPTLGAKVGVELYEQIDIDLEFNVGAAPFGDHSSWSWDVLVGFQWRPIENLGVQIGYRNLAFNLTDGDGDETFEWDGALAGLYGGVVVRF